VEKEGWSCSVDAPAGCGKDSGKRGREVGTRIPPYSLFSPVPSKGNIFVAHGEAPHRLRGGSSILMASATMSLEKVRPGASCREWRG
jgi:hypothetical protein